MANNQEAEAGATEEHPEHPELINFEKLADMQFLEWFEISTVSPVVQELCTGLTAGQVAQLGVVTPTVLIKSWRYLPNTLYPKIFEEPYTFKVIVNTTKRGEKRLMLSTHAAMLMVWLGLRCEQPILQLRKRLLTQPKAAMLYSYEDLCLAYKEALCNNFQFRPIQNGLLYLSRVCVILCTLDGFQSKYAEYLLDPDEGMSFEMIRLREDMCYREIMGAQPGYESEYTKTEMHFLAELLILLSVKSLNSSEEYKNFVTRRLKPFAFACGYDYYSSFQLSKFLTRFPFESLKNFNLKMNCYPKFKTQMFLFILQGHQQFNLHLTMLLRGYQLRVFNIIHDFVYDESRTTEAHLDPVVAEEIVSFKKIYNSCAELYGSGIQFAKLLNPNDPNFEVTQWSVLPTLAIADKYNQTKDETLKNIKGFPKLSSKLAQLVKKEKIKFILGYWTSPEIPEYCKIVPLENI